MEPKVWFKSKTFWVNVLGGIIVLLQYVADIKIIPMDLQIVLMAIINIVLRWLNPKNPLSLMR